MIEGHDFQDLAAKINSEDKRITAILTAVGNVLNCNEAPCAQDFVIEELTGQIGYDLSELMRVDHPKTLAAIVSVMTAILGPNIKISAIRKVRA